MKYTLAGSLLLLLIASTAHADTPTVSIVSLTPGNTVVFGTTVTFDVATSGFVAPRYSLNDTFVDGSLGNIDLNASGQFSWTPETNDVGSHTVTVTATDGNGNTGTAVVNLTVLNNNSSLTVSAPSPSGNVISGQAVSFTAQGVGFSGTPSYTVTDSFTGTSVTNANINSSGYFSWVPTASDAGAHTITITASDAYEHRAQGTVVIEVSPAPASTVVTTPQTVTTPTEVATTPATVTTPTATTVASVAPQFTEDLAIGSNDSQVTQLQQLLTSQGDFTGAVTGYYGNLTQAAVIKFQAANNIPQLGIVGPATRAALNALLTSSTTSTSTSTSSAMAVPTTTTITTPTSTTASPTLTQIRAEVQSIETQLTQVQTQLSQLVGQ